MGSRLIFCLLVFLPIGPPLGLSLKVNKPPQMPLAFLSPLPSTLFLQQQQYPLLNAAPLHFPSNNKRILCPVCSVATKQSYDSDVIIIGAGIAGLSAAHTLARNGKKVVVFEASDDVGGRMRSDEYQGYILDRGFQVFLEGYPNQQKM